MKRLILSALLFLIPAILSAGIQPAFIFKDTSGNLTHLVPGDSVWLLISGTDTTKLTPSLLATDSITGISKIIGTGSVLSLLNDTVLIGDPTQSKLPVLVFQNSVGTLYLRGNSTVDSLQWSTDGLVWLNFGTGGGTDSATVASWGYYNDRADDSLRIDQFDIVSTTDGGTGTDSLIFIYRDSVRIFYIVPDTSRDVTVLQGLPGLLILDSLALSAGDGRLYFGNTTTLYLDSSIMSDIMDNLGINATDSFVNVTGDIMSGALDMGDNAIGNLSGLAGSNTTGNLILHPGSVGGVVYSNWTLGGDFVYSHGGSDIMGFYASSDSGAYFSGNDSARILDFQLARIDTLESELLFRVGTASGVYIDSATFDSMATAKGRFSAGGGGGTVDSTRTGIGLVVNDVGGNDSIAAPADTVNADTANVLASLERLGKVTDDTTALLASKDTTLAWDNRGYPNASVTQKGIASFDATDFSDASGVITIDDDGHAHTSTSLSGIDTLSSTINRTQWDEYLPDIIGAMFTGNTETLITVTYQDADNTVDFVVNLTDFGSTIDSSELAADAKALAEDRAGDTATVLRTAITDTVNLLRNDQILNFHTIAGQVDGPGDSVELSLGGNVSGVAYVARDSSIATAGPVETDSIYFMFVMPSWAETVDSAIIVVQGSSSADSAEVTEIEMFGPDKSSSSVVADSSYYSDVTARNTATAARYAYNINNTQIAAGDPVTILMVTTLGTKAVGTIYIYDVYLKVSD